jgi:hypothetical protein
MGLVAGILDHRNFGYFERDNTSATLVPFPARMDLIGFEYSSTNQGRASNLRRRAGRRTNSSS